MAILAALLCHGRLMDWHVVPVLVLQIARKLEANVILAR
jgi:hypothetical protein